jgi:RimJ/RimL family protein N-acetyltransferase
MPPHISLRDVEDNDLLTFFTQQQDPEALRMAAFPSRDRDAFMIHWSKILDEETCIVRTIFVGPEVAGHICSWPLAGERNIGYWLGREYWGQGIASAALAQFLTVVTTRPLFARVAKHNLASLRVLQKCGFHISGEDTFRYTPDSEPGEEFTLTLAIP